MKKLLTCSLFFIACAGAFAQSNAYYYCSARADYWSVDRQYHFKYNFGNDSIVAQLHLQRETESVQRRCVFNNLVEFVYYMDGFGWELVSDMMAGGKEQMLFRKKNTSMQ